MELLGLLGLLTIVCVCIVWLLFIHMRCKEAAKGHYSYTEGEGRHNYPHLKYGYDSRRGFGPIAVVKPLKDTDAWLQETSARVDKVWKEYDRLNKEADAICGVPHNMLGKDIKDYTLKDMFHPNDPSVWKAWKEREAANVMNRVFDDYDNGWKKWRQEHCDD